MATMSWQQGVVVASLVLLVGLQAPGGEAYSWRSLLGDAAPKYPTVLDMIKTRNDMKLLLAAATATNLTSVLSDPELAATLFLPTDNAFKRALFEIDATWEDLLADPEALSYILMYHVDASEVLFKKDFSSTPKSLIMLSPQLVTVTKKNGVIRVKDVQARVAKVTKPDVTAAKSVIHVIDAVLFPDEPAASK